MSNYYKYQTLEPIRPRIREIEQQITDLEWDGGGMAPEKMSDLLNELQRLQESEAKGELYVPTF